MPKSDLERFGIPTGPARGNPGRSALLGHMQEMRSGFRPAATELDFGAHLLTIPELDYYVICERFPDLKSPDAEIKRRAWLKFARDPASEIYRSK